MQALQSDLLKNMKELDDLMKVYHKEQVRPRRLDPCGWVVRDTIDGGQREGIDVAHEMLLCLSRRGDQKREHARMRARTHAHTHARARAHTHTHTGPVSKGRSKRGEVRGEGRGLIRQGQEAQGEAGRAAEEGHRRSQRVPHPACIHRDDATAVCSLSFVCWHTPTVHRALCCSAFQVLALLAGLFPAHRLLTPARVPSGTRLLC
jgi:hypothetical protein